MCFLLFILSSRSLAPFLYYYVSVQQCDCTLWLKQHTSLLQCPWVRSADTYWPPSSGSHKAAVSLTGNDPPPSSFRSWWGVGLRARFCWLLPGSHLPCHVGLSSDSSHTAVCFFRIGREQARRGLWALPWPCSVGGSKRWSSTLRRRGPPAHGSPSCLSTTFHAFFLGCSHFSSSYFSLVWVIYIFTFQLTPILSQQCVELIGLYILPPNDPRLFNS